MRHDNLSQAIRPARWIPSVARLLPAEASQFVGVPATRWVAIAYLTLITVRSCIHLLAPDGGASFIATVDLSVAGGQNIVAMFGQWGAIQLELAVLLWCPVLRYRGLTPLVLMVFSIEPTLRSLSSHLKPLVTLGTAPGAALNWVVAPLLWMTLYLSLCFRNQKG